MEGGELSWDIEPHNGGNCFFTRDSYEKFSMEPTLAELWLLNRKTQAAPAKASPKSENEEKPPIQQPSIIPQPEVTPALLGGPPLPEPRVPYTRYSSLSGFEQRAYVQLMIKYLNKKSCFRPTGFQMKEYDHYLYLKSKLNSEHAEFLKYLQNCARNSVEDYNWLSADAQHYTQEVLKACQKFVKNYPEVYAVHNMTSILGGKFRTDITLKLEKCLLKMGSAHFVKVTFPTSELPLPTSTAFSDLPPEKKASHMHESVISDPNVSKLATKYSPHVVLTAQALYTLLNNHGVNYKEQWEIPLRVETITAEEAKPNKIVYLDSPLPKKEVSVREQNQMFHEAPVNKFMMKKSGVPLNIINLDKVEPEAQTTTEGSQSRRQEVCNMELDFENDVTELETFGSVKNANKISRNSDTKPTSPASQSDPPVLHTSPPDSAPTYPESLSITEYMRKTLVDKLKIEKQVIKNTSLNKQDDQEILNLPNTSVSHSLWSDTDDASSFEGFDSDEINELKKDIQNSEENTDPNFVNQMTVDTQDTKPPPRQQQNQSDSEDDRLVIDIGNKLCTSKKIISTPNLSTPLSKINSNTPESQCLPRKPVKKISKEFDPVGQILKMQTQLLKQGAKKMQEQSLINVDKSGQLSQNSLPMPFQPVVTAVAHPARTIEGNIATSQLPQLKKSLVPSDLLNCTEDETEYTAPLEENCSYKLFSLDDILLLVRSSVQKAYTKVRAHKKSTRKHIPIYVLTKVNYQSSYGAESLTESESCRLWTESLLHSNCSFYIGHVDALTSKLFMLEEITSEGLRDRISNFKPANSLNILHHILKWVTDLQDGSYLLSHASGDSSVCLYKSISETNRRGTYNLHEAHCSLPKAPSSLSVPWVPLDPNILLPFHIHHSRPPCTFPPPPQGITENFKVGKKRPIHIQANIPEDVQSRAPKKNKGKRPNRLLRWKAKRMAWKAQAAAKSMDKCDEALVNDWKTQQCADSWLDTSP